MAAALCLAIENPYGYVVAVPCDAPGWGPLIEDTKAVVQSAAGGGSSNIPLLEMTPAEGAQIASAMLLVWAVAWGIRQAIRAIQTTGSTEKDE